MGTAALVNLAWYAPVAVCYFAWPLLKRRRLYVVTAAVLCLTPTPDWMVFWPLILPLSLPVLGFEILFFEVVLPYGSFVGANAWLLARRFLSENNQRASMGGSETVLLKQSRGNRYVWLRILRLRLGVLLILLIAVVAYVRVWSVVFRASPLL